MHLRLLMLAPIALGISTPASAEQSYRIPTGKAAAMQNTKAAAMKWELGYLAFSALDTAQLVYCLDKGTCQEGNPLLGKHPSTSKLVLAKVAGGLIHFGVFKYLNDRNPKVALRFAQVSCVVQGSVVMLNARIVF